MFKKLRGVRVPYNKQGLIFFTCRDYTAQSEQMQKKILNACLEVGADYWQALFDVVTTDESIANIAPRHFVSDSTLYRLRRTFYEQWDNY